MPLMEQIKELEERRFTNGHKADVTVAGGGEAKELIRVLRDLRELDYAVEANFGKPAFEQSILNRMERAHDLYALLRRVKLIEPNE